MSVQKCVFTVCHIRMLSHTFFFFSLLVLFYVLFHSNRIPWSNKMLYFNVCFGTIVRIDRLLVDARREKAKKDEEKK